MPQLDDQTYRWLQLSVPIVQVGLTAIVTAVVAVWATRAEADRAEGRAKAEADRVEARTRALVARDTNLALLRETHERLVLGLQRSANVQLPVGQAPLDFEGLQDVALVDDSGAVRELLRLQTDFATRPAHSGLSETELSAIVDVVSRLRASLSRQSQRVIEGKAPARVVADSELVARVQEDLDKVRKLTTDERR